MSHEFIAASLKRVFFISTGGFGPPIGKQTRQIYMALLNIAKKIFGSSNDRRLKPYSKNVAAINALEEQMAALTDQQLIDQTDSFKKRYQDGETLKDLLVEAFAAVREASKRALGLRPYDVQLVGGMVLNSGDIAEMKTGEGKTLVATMPAYLNALTGRGVHIVTVNDYLASRDAEWMARVFERLGITTGVIVHDLSDPERRQAYGADVTYCTNNELGFDYLRDNMKSSMEEMVQRGHHFAIVDEVDSILIDEARTPLIISGPTEDKSDLYLAVAKLIPLLTEDDFEIDEKQRGITLTEDGNEHVEQLLSEADLLEGESLYEAQNVGIVHHVQNALRAQKMFQKDKDYIVKDNKVVIIDEFTGRMMDGRRWSDGLHQAVEAKEGVEIQPENVTLASITFQNYFRLYETLAGMTGTAVTEEGEFQEIYKLNVLEVPTNRPITREDWDDELYISAEEKYKAIVTQIADCYDRGQPILVGTVSIEKSELLSGLLASKQYFKELAKTAEAQADGLKPGKNDEIIATLRDRAKRFAELSSRKEPIPHNVLNARFHEQEAEIIGQAGIPGAVTIATNMAGRGTDIQLGGNVDMEVLKVILDEDTEEMIASKRGDIEASIGARKDEALQAGGLYVLATERHESRRIDNQLRGRSGRQGDPGTTKFYLSLEDDLMRIFGTGMETMLKRFGIQPDESIEHPWFSKAVEKSQMKIEERNFDMRKNVLKYDDVTNEQRKAIFEQRIDFMSDSDVSDTIADMRHQFIEDVVEKYVPPKSYAEQWDIEGLDTDISEIFAQPFPIKEWAAEEGVADSEIIERLIEKSDTLAAEREEKIGDELMRRIEKMILLKVIDDSWREHLQTLDHLRSVVGLRGMGQRDPLSEFKTESFELFTDLLDSLRRDVTGTLFHVQVQQQDPNEAARQMQAEMRASRPDPAQMQESHIDATTGLNDAAGNTGDAPRRAYGQAAGAGTTLRARTAARELNPEDPSTWGRVPRNSACPCGSGNKYKHCHGK